MTDSFWTGGPAAFADAIRKKYRSQLEELRKCRETAVSAERDELDTEIKRLESEYKSKLDSIDDALF